MWEWVRSQIWPWTRQTVLQYVLFNLLEKTTDIQGRSLTLYSAPCNGIISHAAQIGGLWVFANYARKTNASMIFARRAAFYRSRCSDIYTWQTTVILITGKTRRPTISAPYWDENSSGSVDIYGENPTWFSWTDQMHLHDDSSIRTCTGSWKMPFGRT